MIYHFIMNPKSGRHKRLANLEETIQNACQARKLSYHIYYTLYPGDATEYVSSMLRISPDTRQRFICVGGDGTLNEIVNADPTNPSAEYGVIPSGTGNDFIKNFSNQKFFSDVEAQLDGKATAIDIIKCNDYYCINMVNIGFDCAVVKEAVKLKKKKLVTPALSYILGVVVVLCRKFGTKMRIIYDDGEVIDRELTLTAIGNGRFCGGGFMAAPRAGLLDGKFDVCAIDKVSRATFLSLVGSYRSGTYLENKRATKIFSHRQDSHFKMEFEAPIPICIDGEIKGAKSVDFTLLPHAVNFVIPKGSELLYK